MRDAAALFGRSGSPGRLAKLIGASKKMFTAQFEQCFQLESSMAFQAL